MPIGGGGLISRRGHGGQGDPARHPDRRRRGGDVSVVHGPDARPQRADIGGQTIAEGIAVKAVGELTYAQRRPLIDEVLLIEEGDLERAVALYVQRGEDGGRRRGGRVARRPAGLSGASSGARPAAWCICGGNIDHAPAGLGPDARAGARAAAACPLRIVGDDRPGLLATVSAAIGGRGRQHPGGGAQPPGAGRAGQGRGVRHHGGDARQPPHRRDHRGAARATATRRGASAAPHLPHL